MKSIPRRLNEALGEEMERLGFDRAKGAKTRRWARFYLDFCLKYDHPVRDPDLALGAFYDKLASKGQGEEARREAGEAARLFARVLAGFPEPTSPRAIEREGGTEGAGRSGDGDAAAVAEANGSRGRSAARRGTAPDASALAGEPSEAGGEGAGAGTRAAEAGAGAGEPGAAGRGAGPGAGRRGTRQASAGEGCSWEPVYTKLADVMAVRQNALTTRRGYRGWVRHFQSFLKSKDPADISSDDAAAFLTHIARERGVSASTQNQAFNALLFLFRHVLDLPFEPDGVTRAKKSKYIPTTLTREQVDAVVAKLPDPYALVARLMYGCGLRLAEALGLRVKDLDFDSMLLTVRRGKGGKDRTTPLPEVLLEDLLDHLGSVREQFEKDLAAAAFAGAFMPERGSKQNWDRRARDWGWQFFFPAKRLTTLKGGGEQRRFHLHATRFSSLLREAAQDLGIHRRVTSHAFRHSFASHLLMANYDIRTIQEMLGHSDVRTTMIYLQTVPARTKRDRKSPLDLPPDTGGAARRRGGPMGKRAAGRPDAT